MPRGAHAAGRIVDLYFLRSCRAVCRGNCGRVCRAKAGVPVVIATLILALVSLGVGGYIAYAGGRVRHKEFRFEAPPEPNEETTPE
jgi:hypothetical protein